MNTKGIGLGLVIAQKITMNSVEKSSIQVNQIKDLFLLLISIFQQIKSVVTTISRVI